MKRYEQIDQESREITEGDRAAFQDMMHEVADPLLSQGRTSPGSRGGRERAESIMFLYEQIFFSEGEYSLPFPFSFAKAQISGAEKVITEDNRYTTTEFGKERRTDLDSEYIGMRVMVQDKDGWVSHYLSNDTNQSTGETFEDSGHYDRLMTILNSLSKLQDGKHAKFLERVKAMKALKEAVAKEAELDKKRSLGTE